MNFEPDHEQFVNFIIAMTALIGLGLIFIFFIG